MTDTSGRLLQYLASIPAPYLVSIDAARAIKGIPTPLCGSARHLKSNTGANLCTSDAGPQAAHPRGAWAAPRRLSRKSAAHSEAATALPGSPPPR